jgi:cell division protein FtsW (lipid II flippase)
MATSSYDQFSKTASNGMTSVVTQRTSINSLLNPEPDEKQQSYNSSSSYSSQSNGDWYDQSLENHQGQLASLFFS